MTRITFVVPGLPATAGSKKIIPNKRTGRGILVDSCKRGPKWREAVRVCFRTAYKGPPLEGAVSLTTLFCLPRPKSHYRTGKYAGMLKHDAPTAHTTKPDTTKMVRAIEDALSTKKKKGVVIFSGAWIDDSQVTAQNNRKVYADEQYQVGAYITIRGNGIEELKGGEQDGEETMSRQ